MYKKLALLLFLTASATQLSAQWFSLQIPGVPRTADGKADMAAAVPMSADNHPDFSGLWVADNASGSLFDSSKILGWAQDAMLEQEASFYANDPRFHCLPSGPAIYPAGMSVGGVRRIVQTPSFIAVLNSEMNFRQIYMDGRQLEENPMLPTWEGYSVGHWEGDILVVESNGFNDKTWLTREGLPHTDQLRMTERYQRLDYGHTLLDVTYDDPGTFTEVVQATIELTNLPDSGMLEIVCNESATGRSHYGGEISATEQNIVEVPRATLASYTGVYQGMWLGNLITAEILLEDTGLVLVRSPRYSDTGGNTDSAKSRLIPMSENAFDCSCGLGFIFAVDDSGKAFEVSEVHVSGAWPFKRVE